MVKPFQKKCIIKKAFTITIIIVKVCERELSLQQEFAIKLPIWIAILATQWPVQKFVEYIFMFNNVIEEQNTHVYTVWVTVQAHVASLCGSSICTFQMQVHVHDIVHHYYYTLVRALVCDCIQSISTNRQLLSTFPRGSSSTKPTRCAWKLKPFFSDVWVTTQWLTFSPFCFADVSSSIIHCHCIW